MAQTWFGRSIGQPAQQIRVDLVPGRRLRGVGLAVESLDAHPLHQRRDMPATNLEALRRSGDPAASGCPRTGNSRCSSSIRRMSARSAAEHRPWQVIDAAPADPERLGLPGDRQIMRSGRSSLCAQQTGLAERAGQKIVAPASARRSWHAASSHRPGSAASAFGFRSRTPRQPRPEAAPSSCVIWLGCTSNCCASSASVFSPFTAAKATFALKAGVWFRRGRLRHRLSCAAAILAAVRQKLHLSRCPDFPSHLCSPLQSARAAPALASKANKGHRVKLVLPAWPDQRARDPGVTPQTGLPTSRCGNDPVGGDDRDGRTLFPGHQAGHVHGADRRFVDICCQELE